LLRYRIHKHTQSPKTVEAFTAITDEGIRIANSFNDNYNSLQMQFKSHVAK